MAAEGKYADLSRDELIRLLEARDRWTRFGLVWEASEIERDAALNRDFVALDLCPELSCGPGLWRNLVIEGDNFDALRCLKMAAKGRRDRNLPAPEVVACQVNVFPAWLFEASSPHSAVGRSLELGVTSAYSRLSTRSSSCLASVS